LKIAASALHETLREGVDKRLMGTSQSQVLHWALRSHMNAITHVYMSMFFFYSSQIKRH